MESSYHVQNQSILLSPPFHHVYQTMKHVLKMARLQVLVELYHAVGPGGGALNFFFFFFWWVCAARVFKSSV